MRKAKAVNQKQVGKYLRRWKRRLGLQDWVVAIRFNDKVLKQKGRMAEIDTLPEKRTAWLTMRKTMPERDLFGYADVELTVIHELLHCWFSALGGERTHEEQAVHALSWALRKGNL